MSNTLRTGFTTGTCAAAGAKAGVLAIKEQKNIDAVDVLLPRGTFAKIQIIKCEFQSSSAICTVIKDGGDDPDVTHGAEIVTKISLEGEPEQIRIQGGKGVGKVTKPGLGLEIGKHAINPVPKKMIEQSVREIGKEMLHDTGILVTVSVPNGEKIALKTDNPRLGIIGGISILGTSGIVTPFSTASYAAAIRQNIQVASAMKDDTVVLTTGGRSEEYAMKTIKLADHCFVQIGDFSGYAIRECAKNGIKIAYVMGFIGKLAKMAAKATFFTVTRYCYQNSRIMQHLFADFSNALLYHFFWNRIYCMFADLQTQSRFCYLAHAFSSLNAYLFGLTFQ